MSGENRDPQSEPGIGRSLERARKDRGLSLWQVEQETRIRSRYLRDLEREDFDVLPAVYVLGSLKTYADFLGLDGAALSRQLKASLVEPDEPDVATQVAAIGGARDGEDEYEAAPVPAVGFDQLFIGMGVILISILAIMTLAAAVAQGDRAPVSQVDQPSTPEPPSEIALAGNVEEGEDEGDGIGTSVVNEEDEQENGPEASKNDESKNDEQDGGEGEDQDAPQATSLFGDAEFVPMSPSSPSTASAASAASASASPAPPTAKPDDSSVPTAPASRATSEPADDYPGAASAPPDASAPAPDAARAPAPAPARAPAPAGPQGGGGGSPPQGPAPGSGPVSADVDGMIDEVFRENGLD